MAACPNPTILSTLCSFVNTSAAVDGLTLKESKCHFGKSSLDLLGYQIRQTGITAQPAKTQPIAKLPVPTTVTELRSFLGMASYYR